jgi:DNA-binding transcriptional MerR regulator
MKPSLRIGEVASLSGCSPETIRHYEKLGLLETPYRTSSGYRLYDIDAVDRLGFIRHGRELGLDLRTIGELLGLADHPDADCCAVDAIASKHLEQIEARVASLQQLADELHAMVSECHGGPVAECRIIGALFRRGVAA